MKKYRRVITVTLKSDAKFEEKLTLGSKNDMRNLVNFNASSGWKFALQCASFVETILCLSQNSTEEICIIKLKNDAKFEEELTCVLKNERNVANFDPKLESIKICTLLGSFWPKHIMSELKKLQRSYVLWHWRVIQYLKKNWRVIKVQGKSLTVVLDEVHFIVNL